MTSPLDRLTPQERRLLSLLAQGHTAKTIANAEGLSVNVVNERLRAARRKTGAVSSRELARLVGSRDLQPSQENRSRFFGIEDAPPTADRFRSQALANGGRAGFDWRLLMVPGVLFLAAVAGHLTVSPQAVEQTAPPPLMRPAPGESGWTVVNADRRAPAITYLVPAPDRPSTHRLMVVLECRGIWINVVVRGFAPANTWPQPPLTTRIGTAERIGPPQVTASGDLPSLKYAFNISDAVLQPLAEGEPIGFAFNGETLERPPVPMDLAAWFVERCGAIVHPGMRRADAAGTRVY